MAFPVSPTEGQTFTENNTVWIYSAVMGQWNRSVINPLNETLYKFGSASATGNAGEIQYTDGTNLAASPNLLWDNANNELEVGGDVVLDDGGTYTTTLQTITPTAARTISFPDATGTVGLVGGSSGNLVVNQSGAYAGVANSSVDNATGNITLGSRFISSFNGAASAPPGTFTGTWFTGGTATTTKPQVLIEPTGATSTAWSTSGTGLGVNAASGFAGNLLDLQLNGTSRAVVTGAGQLLVGTSSARSDLANLAPRFQVEGSDGSASSLSLTYNLNDFAGPSLLLAKSRGTTAGAVTAVQNGDILGGVYFLGTDGTNADRAAQIICVVDGTPGANDMPGRLVFSTTADGSATPTERMRIKSAGTINFSSVSTYADNTAALAGGLVAGDVYRKSDGTLMITY
jgi:hypothetical protein